MKLDDALKDLLRERGADEDTLKWMEEPDAVRSREQAMRRALHHARDELRRARSSESGRRLLFHTIDPCLTHINEVLGDPDEYELP